MYNADDNSYYHFHNVHHVSQMEINGSTHLIPWLIFGICLMNVILGVDGWVGVLVKVCVANPMHLLPPKVYLTTFTTNFVGNLSYTINFPLSDNTLIT